MDQIENSNTGSTAGSEVENLRKQVSDLRRLLVLSLMALVILGAALDIYARYEMTVIRKELAAQRPQLTQVIDDFKNRGAGEIEKFAKALQEYAKTHPDMTPILARYNLAHQSESASTPPVSK